MKFKFIMDTFLSRGLKIFPCGENEKTPLIDMWQKDCSCDFQQVVYWLENAKNCNIGLPANENNLFVIDVDNHGVDGLANFKRLCDDLGVGEIKTLTQKTPSGGLHLIFESDDELKKVMNSSNCFENYQGIDVRTRGYILVEPSEINGVKYKLNTTYGVSKMPNALKEFIIKNNKKQEVVKKSEYKKPPVVEKGNRDTALFEYINNLYYTTRLTMEEISLLAHYFNECVCVPPLSEGVVNYKIKKLFEKKRNTYIILRFSEEQEEE